MNAPVPDYPDTPEKVLARLDAPSWDPTLALEAAKLIRRLLAASPSVVERMRELLGRFAEFERDADGYCDWCGTTRPLQHASDCIYPEVQAVLADNAPEKREQDNDAPNPDRARRRYGIDYID